MGRSGRSRYTVLRDVAVGQGTRIHDQVNLYKCKVGRNCKIDAFVYIEEGVEIGDDVKIRPFTFIPTGVTIGDGVYIGPGVIFTNDKYPRSRGRWRLLKTTVERGASVGAGAVINPGVTIGEEALIGAGAVVTSDVPPRVIVAGNPAKILGNVDNEGFQEKLKKLLEEASPREIFEAR